MHPVELRSGRLLLSVPTLDDVELLARYCQDPLFERYLTTPWPFGRSDAVGYVDAVARWWAGGLVGWWAGGPKIATTASASGLSMAVR